MASLKRFWTINGDFVGLKATGVARYAREVTQALDALIAEEHPLTKGLDVTLVVPREPENFPLKAMGVKLVPEFNKPRLPQFWVQMQLPWHVKGGLVSLCNLAPVRVRRQIACIHDLHTYVMPESYGRGFRLAHKMVLPRLGRRARYITTVSEHSRDHLVQFGVAPQEKVVVTYNGADHALRWNAAASQLDFGHRPFVLCLGQTQAYKNIGLVLKIADALDAIGLDVFIAGDVKAEALPLPQPGGTMPKNVRLLGRISDDDLARALNLAVCFLFPSRIEGFGIPAVEAMTFGCPVVAASAPCLPEVCGDGALYAGPDDLEAWVDTVRRLCGDENFRRKQGEKGRERAKRYTWRGIAEIYLQLMEQTDSETMPGAIK